MSWWRHCDIEWIKGTELVRGGGDKVRGLPSDREAVGDYDLAAVAKKQHGTLSWVYQTLYV